MEALEELVRLCKAEVSVTINPHTVNYETIPEYLEHQGEKIDPEILQEMFKRDRLVWVQVYPHTPIGFYSIYHYDIETAIKEVLEAVKTGA